MQLRFFGGDIWDGLIATICGLSADIIEFLMCTLGGDTKIRIDILVGISTGIIGSFFMYRDTEDIESQVCLPEVFMGALYWFFYGTAFVIGILEIISGQLETDVVRFMGVSVKTFVLTLGTTVGIHF